MAAPSYQQMAAHLAMQSRPDAPQENNTFIQLRNFYNNLNTKMAMLGVQNMKLYRTVLNMTLSIQQLLDNATSLSTTAQEGDAEKTRNQLEKTAVACKNFQDALGTFKDVALKEPTFWTNAKDVENIEKAKYKQGGPILDAADVYVLELKEEDIEEIKENLGEDQKEELFPRQINEEKEDANSLYYKHSQKLEKEKLQREAEENARIREEQETAQNYVDNYVKPIPAVTWSVSETNSSKRKYEPSLFDRPTAEKSWKNYRLHHLSGVDPDHPDFKENLAKAIVATFQMNRPKKEQDPFSVKLARSEAKQLMNLPTFKRFTESPALVRKYLNEDKLFQVCGGLFRPFHLTQKDKAFDILSALKKLPDKMDDPEGQPKEWKSLVKTLRNIDPYADDEERERQMQAAFDATAAYMKGRKSVRSTPEEQNQFNQAMDVLGTLAKAGDFAKNAANVIVDRTNEVRDRVFHKHETIRLSDFGEDKIDQHMNKSARSNSLGEINLEADSGSIKSL